MKSKFGRPSLYRVLRAATFRLAVVAKWGAVLGLLAFAFLITAGLPRIARAEESVSTATPAFPEVRGQNLDGRWFNLPADFEGERNLVFVAFERGQQAEVDTWLPLARRLTSEISGVRYYELPTIRKLPGFVRGWIDGGMRDGIPDPAARAATITLYLDKEPFRRALDIRTEKSITILVVDRSGAVHWQTVGVWTPEKESALRTLLSSR